MKSQTWFLDDSCPPIALAMGRRGAAAALLATALLAAGLLAGCGQPAADATVEVASSAEPAVDPSDEAPAVRETAEPASEPPKPVDGLRDAAAGPPESETGEPPAIASSGKENDPENTPSAAPVEAGEADSPRSADDSPPTKVFSSSRAPSRPGEAEKISFDDLIIGVQADVVYRPWMMKERPKELDGKKVRISGFMHGGIENPDKVPEFVLLRNLECKFGPGGQADHLAMVYMKPGTTTTYIGKDPIKVEGVLRIEPFLGVDGNTWSIYRIDDAAVVR
jgi:hypothetical protein